MREGDSKKSSIWGRSQRVSWWGGGCCAHLAERKFNQTRIEQWPSDAGKVQCFIIGGKNMLGLSSQRHLPHRKAKPGQRHELRLRHWGGEMRGLRKRNRGISFEYTAMIGQSGLRTQLSRTAPGGTTCRRTGTSGRNKEKRRIARGRRPV